MKSFLKQRFRWSFGVLQVLYKHIDIFSDSRVSTSLKWIILPQMIVFQVIFPLFSPIIDLSVIASLVFALINYGIYSSTEYLDVIVHILGYGCIFIVLDFLVGCIALWMEKDESWSMIMYLPLQRIVYKWIMYLLHIRVLWNALSGKMSLWNKAERTNSVREK